MAEKKYFRTHRNWEDWIGIGLGLLIVLAPWVVDETSNRSAVINATLVGFAVLLLAELDLVQFRRWPEIGQLACGIWIAMSPYVFGYSGSGALRIWHLVAGLMVALLGFFELWQGRDATNKTK